MKTSMYTNPPFFRFRVATLTVILEVLVEVVRRVREGLLRAANPLSHDVDHVGANLRVGLFHVRD